MSSYLALAEELLKANTKAETKAKTTKTQGFRCIFAVSTSPTTAATHAPYLDHVYCRHQLGEQHCPKMHHLRLWEPHGHGILHDRARALYLDHEHYQD